MHNATAILVTLIVYKVVLILIGVWANKRTHSTSDYFLGKYIRKDLKNLSSNEVFLQSGLSLIHITTTLDGIGDHFILFCILYRLSV